MSRKEYFAYGSNLNFEQMSYRCPEASAVGIAKLDGYELAFRRGYLTILPKEGASVEGLIWSVTDHDESQLDCYEGYPTFYDKETLTVTDADGTPHEIMVYTMNAPYRDQLLPVSSRYNAVVLQGCLDAGISPQQFYDADEKYRNSCICGNAILNADTQTLCAPMIGGNARVYGELTGNVVCQGSAIVLPGVKLYNTTADCFALKDDTVSVVPAQRPEVTAPKETKHHENER